MHAFCWSLGAGATRAACLIEALRDGDPSELTFEQATMHLTVYSLMVRVAALNPLLSQIH